MWKEWMMTVCSRKDQQRCVLLIALSWCNKSQSKSQSQFEREVESSIKAQNNHISISSWSYFNVDSNDKLPTIIPSAQNEETRREMY